MAGGGKPMHSSEHSLCRRLILEGAYNQTYNIGLDSAL